MDDRAAAGLELRIHGIGNHAPLDSLGTPHNIDDARRPAPNSAPDAHQPAIVAAVTPHHELWLVAWTRSARSRQRFAWFVKIPFTLVNTAGRMRPATPWQRRIHAAAVDVLGLMLTVGAYLWTVVILEVAIYRLSAARAGELVYSVVAVATCLLWVVSLLSTTDRVSTAGARAALVEQEIEVSARRRGMVHALVVLGVMAAVFLVRPRQHTYAPMASCLIGPPGPDCLVYTYDWTTLVALATLGLAAVVAVTFAVWSWLSPDRGWSGERADPLLGAGLVLLAATLCLHVGASLLQLLVDNVSAYLKRHEPWGSGLDFGVQPLLRAYDVSATPFSGFDVIAVPWAPWVTAASALIVLWRFAVRPVRAWAEREERVPWLAASARTRRYNGARRVHRWVCERHAGFLCATTVVGVAAAVWIVVDGVGRMVRLQHEARMAALLNTGLPIRDGAFLADYVVAAHSFLVLFALGWFSANTRQTLAVLGDVAGYWPVARHPLSGIPYRFDIVETVAQRLVGRRGPVVVVGHSQGSVLAADVVRRLSELDPEAARMTTLVTCGSPLQSLYSRFFPGEFNVQRKESIRGSVTAWRNYWRDTDPISTPLSGGGLVEVCDKKLADPREPAGTPLVVRAHGDYWLEERQANYVAAQLETLRAAHPSPRGATDPRPLDVVEVVEGAHQLP